MPASDLDYFWHECVALFGIDGYYGVPHYPKTPYYRLSTLAMPPEGLLIELGIPLHQPGTLDPEVVDRYKQELQEGSTPAAFAVGVLDIRQPAVWKGKPEFTEHYVLAQYLLDGHHKMQAAAELGADIQVLSFVSREQSMYGYGSPADLDRVLATRIVDAPDDEPWARDRQSERQLPTPSTRLHICRTPPDMPIWMVQDALGTHLTHANSKNLQSLILLVTSRCATTVLQRRGIGTPATPDPRRVGLHRPIQM
jgi:hypothetical protein